MSFPTNIFGGGGGGLSLPSGSGGFSGQAIIGLGVRTANGRAAVKGMVNDINGGLEQGRADIENRSRKVGAAFNVIKAGAVLAGAGIAGALFAGATAAIGYESAFAGVRKTVDASEPEFQRMRQQFRDMSKEIPITASALAGLAETAGALGIAKDDIASFVRTTALLGETTDVSADQAATALGQLSTVLQLRAEDYERFGSTLVDLGNKGASTESQILDMAARAGAGAHLIGLSAADLLGFSSAMANMGIEVEAGGTSLQTFFLTLMKTVNEGKDGLDLLAKVSGRTAKQFKQDFERDAAGAITKLIEGLSRLPKSDQLGILSDLGFKDVRITRALLGLAGNTDNLRNSINIANQAWRDNNALQNEAQKRFDTTASKLKILGNRFGDILVSLGDAVLPGLNNLLSFLSDALPRAAQHLADVWNQTLGPAVTGLWNSFTDLVGAVASLFEFDGKGSPLSGLQGAFDLLATSVSTVAEWLGRIMDIFTGLLNSPVGHWIGELAIAVGGIRLGFAAIVSSVRALSRFGSSTLRFMSFGRLGSTADTANTAGNAGNNQSSQIASQQLETSGRTLGSAGDSLKLAAQEQMRAAESLMAAARANLGLPPGPAVGTAGPGTTPLRGIAPAVPILAEDAVLPLRARVAAQAAGTKLFQAAAFNLADGTEAAAATGLKGGLARAGATLRSAGSRAMETIGNTMTGMMAAGATTFRVGKTALGTGLGIAAKAFWPVLIGSMVADIAAQPLGQWVADNISGPVGRKMQKNLIGGIFDGIVSLLNGTDAWVGHADELQFGTAKIKSIDAAKMGFSSADIGHLEVGDMEGVALQVTVAQREATDIAKARDQGVAAYLSAVLDAAGRRGIDVDALQQSGALPYRGLAAPADLARIDAFVQTYLQDQLTQTRSQVQQAVSTGLADVGLGKYNEFLVGMTPGQLAEISSLLGQNINGELTPLIEYILRNAVKDIKPLPPNVDALFRPLPTPTAPSAAGPTSREKYNSDLEARKRQVNDWLKWLQSQEEPFQTAYEAFLQPLDESGHLDQALADARKRMTEMVADYHTAIERGAGDNEKAFKAMQDLGLIDPKVKFSTEAWDKAMADFHYYQSQTMDVEREKLKTEFRKGAVEAFKNGVDLSNNPVAVKIAADLDIDLAALSKAGTHLKNAENFKQYVTLAAKAGIDLSKDDVVTELAGMWGVTLPQAAKNVDPVQAAKAVQDMIELADKLGIDYLKDFPGLEKLIERYKKMFGDATIGAQPDAINKTSTLIQNAINNLPGVTDKEKQSLIKHLQDAADALKDTDFPGATAASVALIQQFIDSLPDGALKTALTAAFTSAMTDSTSESLPTAGDSGKEFLRAFINALPPEAADLKRLLQQYLDDWPDPTPKPAIDAGHKVMGKLKEGILASQAAITGAKNTVINNAANAPLSDQTKTDLWRSGQQIMIQIARGVTGNGYTLGQAIADAERRAMRFLPSSPVKDGPFKHPFLPNAGRKIIEQVAAGITGAAPAASDALRGVVAQMANEHAVVPVTADVRGFSQSMPAGLNVASQHVTNSTAMERLAVAMDRWSSQRQQQRAGQQIHIDRLELPGTDQSERSILERMKFLAPESM